MDPNAALEITRQLDSGESLLWAGVPKQGLILQATDIFLIPFSLVWCSFAVFWEWMALTSGLAFFAVWGIPFVCIGLYFVVGRFVADARLRARTYYGLTQRRVIIVSGLFSRTVNSLPLRALHDISLVERADRSGTVMFGRPHPFASRYAGLRWPGLGHHQVPCFELIQDARRVHNRVLEAQSAAA